LEDKFKISIKFAKIMGLDFYFFNLPKEHQTKNTKNYKIIEGLGFNM